MFCRSLPVKMWVISAWPLSHYRMISDPCSVGLQAYKTPGALQNPGSVCFAPGIGLSDCTIRNKFGREWLRDTQMLLPPWESIVSIIQQTAVGNRLLRLLSEADFQRIARHLEPLDLPIKYKLAEVSQTIGYGYFLRSGIGSIVVGSPEGQRAEAGLFGREGWAPPPLAMGSKTSPYDIFMQVAGDGHRIERDALLEAMEQSATLRTLLSLFVQTLTTQTAFTALSNAVHHVDERLARWILMCHDRVDGDEIHLTHEFLSLMLAVRRPSVTTALHVLEGNRFIRAERGTITIRDRQALEAFAADTYGKPEKEYRQLIGSMN